MTTPSQGFLEAQKKLKTYTVLGLLEAEPRGGLYWLFDYWRNSMLQEWIVTPIGEGLSKSEALTLGAWIHPNNQ